MSEFVSLKREKGVCYLATEILQMQGRKTLKLWIVIALAISSYSCSDNVTGVYKSPTSNRKLTLQSNGECVAGNIPCTYAVTGKVITLKGANNIAAAGTIENLCIRFDEDVYCRE